MQIYGSPEPPAYNLTNVRANVHLMHGTNDWLTPSDVSEPKLFLKNPKISRKKLSYV